MYSPFNVNSIEKFILALSYPSAAAFQMDEASGKDIKRSHIIFQSHSINLFIRYVSELQFTFDIEFSDAIPVKVFGDDYDYSFLSIGVKKEEKRQDLATMNIRSIYQGDLIVAELDKGMFSDSWKWSAEFVVITNVGIMRFDG